MINEIKKDNKENIQSTYAYKQDVQIIRGFYKGRWGKVTEYKNNKYVIESIIDDKTHIIICIEEDLRPKKGWFGK